MDSDHSIKLMRNSKNGIPLINAFYYKMLHSKLHTTQQEIVSTINYDNGTSFSRQSYSAKEKNVPLQCYENCLNRISDLRTSLSKPSNIPHLVAIDGTYGSNSKNENILNMGSFDIGSDIPIDISYIGTKNQNNEIRALKDDIEKNIDKYKNVVLICDRLYFAYHFIDFLNNKKIKYIIRIKGDGDNLDPEIKLKKIPNYNLINKIRNTGVRLVKSKNNCTQSVKTDRHGVKINILTLKSNCNVVTNLIDTQIYSDKSILNFYKCRWDVEVFFKLLKNNFKFERLPDCDIIQTKKMYICELIIINIVKLFELYHWNRNNKPTVVRIKKKKSKYIEFGICTVKINKSNMIKGVYGILFDILCGHMNDKKIDSFCKTNILIVKNESGRHYPRTSNIPFTKWYIKMYSDMAKFKKIINAIQNDTVDELNKNLKLIAKKIIKINEHKYN
jgi:hypothetical protein